MKPPPNREVPVSRNSNIAGLAFRHPSLHLALLFGILSLLPAAPPARAQSNSEFSVQLIDGLNRPVPGVSVEVYRLQKQTDGREEKIELGTAVSDTNGIARGLYNKSSIPTNESFSVVLSRDGYAGYTAGPRVNYVIKRLFHDADITRILALPAEAQRRELRESLAGEMDPAGAPLDEMIFSRQDQARASLRWLLDDPQIGAQAGELLAFIGQPDDVRLLVQFAPDPNGDAAVNRWAYAVASALLEPSAERQWSFLKKCAADNYGDHWVDTAAIRTLRLIASPRSLQTLQEARELNPYRTNEIDRAIAYIISRPPPLSAPDAGEAARRLAQALDAGTWMGNEPPRYDRQGDAAVVDCNFLAGGSQFLVFTATLRNQGESWRVSGVRVTRQKLLPKAPAAGKAQTPGQ
jgi:hypothetical protein